jgi:hypothetical protein
MVWASKPENVEQAPSPALLKNSRGRLFYSFLSRDRPPGSNPYEA